LINYKECFLDVFLPFSIKNHTAFQKGKVKFGAIKRKAVPGVNSTNYRKSNVSTEKEEIFVNRTATSIKLMTELL
jgi:hypothetical protein